MKSTYIKIKIQYCLMLVLASLIVLGITVQSCNKEEDMPLVLDEEILNSTELEEFVIAGIDFYQSLAIFSEGLKKLNYFDLEVTYDAEGREIRHIPPALIGNIRIEEKIYALNIQKDKLRKKYPQLISFRKDIGGKYIEHSIKHSVNVKTEMLRMGIDIARPKLKNGNEPWDVILSWFAEDLPILFNQLMNWVNSSGYKELAILVNVDGSFTTYLDPAATDTSCSVPFDIINGKRYFGGKQVWGFGHTHKYSPSPSDADSASARNRPDIAHFIFYNYDIYSFTGY